jgi:hypothetical protein
LAEYSGDTGVIDTTLVPKGNFQQMALFAVSVHDVVDRVPDTRAKGVESVIFDSHILIKCTYLQPCSYYRVEKVPFVQASLLAIELALPHANDPCSPTLIWENLRRPGVI